ncbi:alpha/beta-hydrolase [Trichodelitschia bisporula]|uniref:Alpha/beta-hydrolase n=1 Tax=Trichodelitschia bisporula TaxID=703511 RepID=A0A6G1HKM5_9PEZI|nr:alpha/beta-hydrolase [Trichodelitschia bisporula]
MPSLRSFLCLAFAALVRAGPLPDGYNTRDSLGIDAEAGPAVDAANAATMPVVTLPYGQHRASKYDAATDIYTFNNIRFAAAPVGDLRWKKPQPPLPVAGVQDGSKGAACISIVPKVGLNFLGDANYNASAAAQNAIIGGLGAAAAPLIFGGAEDCLFLDVYVPGKAVREPEKHKLPVVNWIYGGAVILGSKDMLGVYSGNHLIELSNNSMIFVSANYRLGTFGWLAGRTMEKESTPNLGLWDQRAALQWIQSHIHLFGGDRTTVSAWGESAGASSILHHLIAFGGKQDPLFRRAVLQSPAFEPMGDRLPNGTLEAVFQNFTSLAGCAGKGLACLRKAPLSALNRANQAIQDAAPRGAFGVGPAADGSWVRQFPAIEMKRGAVWPGLESAIISHTADEGTIFVDGHIQSDAAFDGFVTQVFGQLATNTGFLTALQTRYPAASAAGTKYANVTARVKDFIRDSSFTCNVRYLTQALGPKTWNMQYSVSPGWHGLDILATFTRGGLKIGGTTYPATGEFGRFARTYQSYLVSHAVTGDPNTLSIKTADTSTVAAVPWPKTPRFVGENIENVLDAGNGTFAVVVDKQVPKTSCEWLQEFEEKITNQLGLAPGQALYGNSRMAEVRRALSNLVKGVW